MNTNLKTIVLLTILLAISLSIVSYYGVFNPATYQRDSVSMAVQGVGQDLVDLFLVVPILLFTLFYVVKNKRWAWLVYTGTVIYILYSFFVYCFGVHFNNLFLWYCATLGLSFYILVAANKELFANDLKSWFGDNFPVKSVAVFFIIIAIMFYALWLKDIIPAIKNDTVPKVVNDYNLPVNPVHVLDIALLLPGFIISGFLVLRRNRAAYIMAAVLLVFIILMATALLTMVIMMAVRGIDEDLSVAYIFSFLALTGVVLFSIVLKNLKTI